MLRRIMLFMVFFGLLPYSNVQALEDLNLATAVAEYQQRLAERTVPADFIKSAVLRRAVNYSRQQLWLEAIDQYEGLIAAGENEALIWLGLSEAWHNAPAERVRGQGTQRALQAAYRAYLQAQNEPVQARALFQLGRLYADANQSQAALEAWREGLGLAEDQDIARRYQRLADSLSFQIKGVEVESDGSEPRVCLRFSNPLQTENPPVWEDYIQIDPAITATISAEDYRLCVAGVEHGAQYQITLKPGIPAASGARTETRETFTAQVDDRYPTLGFRGADYVLPRDGSQDLPLTTINVERAALEVLRINDRNLVNQINERELYSMLSGHQVQRIASRSGERVWQGELSINKKLNEEVTTAIPIQQIIADPEPGIYIVSARNAEQEADDWDDLATQWLVISDLGLSTFQGADGLHVFVRSLADTSPLADVHFTLISRNNSELGTARSDAEGHALFDPGLLRGKDGAEPALLLASAPANQAVDYNFLDLSRPPFDLSDRGVAGRAAPGPLDAYLYSERGVYRPGETVELMVLLRDQRGFAINRSLPLTLSLIRPDQVEADRYTLSQDLSGGYYARLPIPSNARTGSWRVKAYADPSQDPVGELELLVEDFVPQQLKLVLNADSSLLRPSQTATVDLQGDYLYGAPAANLKAAAELILRQDSQPFPEYPDFQFGRVEETFESQRFSLDAPATDAAGSAQLTVRLEEKPDTSRPLQVQLRASLFEPGGRPVNQVLNFPYRVQPLALGIKAEFDGDLALGQEAVFQLIALNDQGQLQVAENVNVELVRENYEYYWYYADNRWDYRLIVRDSTPLTRQTLTIPSSGSIPFRYSGLDWGAYRLDVSDPSTGVSSSLRFNVGWYAAPSENDAPDKLRITLDKPEYQVGETAQIRIEAPFAGRVLLTVASEHLWQAQHLDLPAEGLTVPLPVSADWTSGVYLTATAFRPTENNSSQRGPGRAVGVTWLGLDRAPRTLNLTLDVPSEVRPRQTVELPMSVSGLIPGQPAYVTLAAVDEGILQLTDFKSPDPLDYFLGKRRLGVELLDLYGKLIVAGGERGALRSGAGDEPRNLEIGAVKSTRTVALFSGPVAVDNDGFVRIPLDLPDFNGQLRLMAVAWDAERFGQAEQTLLVRDPLVTQLYLPRFLAPRDSAIISLNIQSLSAVTGDYQLRLSAEGAVSLEDQRTLTFRVNDPNQSTSEQHQFRLKSLEPGVGRVTLEVDGPDGFSLLRDWELSVRPAQTYITDRQARQLAPGETLALNAQAVTGLLNPELQVSVASTPPLDVPTLLQQLDRYPYGCLEQTTSRALPLLYLTDTGAAYNVGVANSSDPRRNRIQQAVQRVLAMQHHSGGFGLWSQDSPAEIWLSAYAMEFLVRAKTRSYLVPESPYRRGLDWLQDQLGPLNYDSFDDLANRAYILYVLALAQQAPVGELRYLHDNHLERLPTRLARAQLGAALAYYGDQQRAQAAFAAAEQPSLGELERIFDYGTELRDQAAVLALKAESGTPAAALAQETVQLAAQFQERSYTSTQEQAWLLLAAHALGRGSGDLSLRLAGQTLGADSDPLYLNPDLTELQQGLTLTNTGTAPAWYVLSRSGIPTHAQAAETQGIELTRRYFSREGEPLEPSDVLQNELMVVLIEGHINTREPHQLLVVDLLPAGLELENARLGYGDTLDAYPWLENLSYTDHVELRDDRFVAALKLNAAQREFRVAYLARAVTPGDYVLPAVFAEDMYKPWYFGRGEMARLAVK